MLGRQRQQGDTLIEVLFAITVFAMVLVGSLTLMNRGLAASQRSLEITQVRQEIDGQAEALRFLRDSYVSVYRDGVTAASLTGPAREWALMVAGSASATAASSFGADASGNCKAIPTRAFVINPKTATYVSRSSVASLFNDAPGSYAQLEYATGTTTLSRSKGLWIEAVRSVTSTDPNQRSAGYIDFHIRACWDGPSTSRAMTLGTIVRLYEPRS